MLKNIALILTITVLSEQIYADVCSTGTTRYNWERSQTVLLVRVNEIVTEIEVHEDPWKRGRIRGYFKTLKTYKGNERDVPYLISLKEPYDSLSGEIRLQPDSIYLVYSYKPGSVFYSTCHPGVKATKIGSDETKVIEALSLNQEIKTYRGYYNQVTREFYDPENEKIMTLKNFRKYEKLPMLIYIEFDATLNNSKLLMIELKNLILDLNEGDLPEFPNKFLSE